MSTSSFHHYPNPIKALLEIKRVLKENGSFIILDACRDYFLEKLYNLQHTIFEKGHVKYYNSKELIGFFKRANFRNVNLVIKKSNFFENGKFYYGVMMLKGEK